MNNFIVLTINYKKIKLNNMVVSNTTKSISVVTLMLMFGCSSPVKQEPLINLEKTEIEKQSLQVAQEYINYQYEYLTTDSSKAKWNKLNDTEVIDSTEKIIEMYKTGLASIKFKFTAYSSKLTLDSIQIDSFSVKLFVKDFFTLTTNDKQSKDSSKYIISSGLANYIFTLTKSNNKWWIKSFVSTDPFRFYFNSKIQIGEMQFNKSSKPSPFSYTYKPDDAVRYAKNYWSSGNTQYCDYSGGGGDCTNFLSQCLNSGGWTQSNDWRSKLKMDCPSCKNWFPSCITQDCYTCNWTVANEFFNYLLSSDRVESSSFPVNSMSEGDIIQFDFNGDGYIDHSSIVVEKSTSSGTTNIYVAYRNAGTHLPQGHKLVTTMPGTYYTFKVKTSAN